MHLETAQCLRTLARLSYVMGDHLEALALQQKATLMSEHVNGIDHLHTVAEYSRSARRCVCCTEHGTSCCSSAPTTIPKWLLLTRTSA